MIKLLIDNNLSPQLCKLLVTAGIDCLHVKDVGKQAASDSEIFNFAYDNDLTIITADTDFGFLLSQRSENKPSIILFRFFTYNPQVMFSTLQKIIQDFESELSRGALLLIEPEKIRIRSLPLHQ